ncbi:winged helix-turn-helix domain-containing protein [Streptomyces sp. NPDC004732]|uniref:winged helix-turn-helix domain-containing protein n=1 Tax=Streptomyces sp. NPDC004732 TaxID=3154290 RepID=UPI0033BEF776
MRRGRVPEASPRGTYLVISETLRKSIEKGEVVDTLPSEAALMAAKNVSRNTIRRALKVLEEEGVLESVPGSGWRVARGERPTHLAGAM